MPSIVAQSRPAPFAVAFRFEANFFESRRAGGVGSGSCALSQIVAALGGPSISGGGAGFSFGKRIVRSFVAFQPRAAFAVCLAVCLADCFGSVTGALVAAVPAVDGSLRPAGGVVSSTGVAPSAGVAGEVASAAGVAVGSAATVAAVLVSAGPAPASMGAATAAEASSVTAGGVPASVVVVSPASCWLSSPGRRPTWLPATAASDAPAKKSVVKTNVVASRRFLDLGSPDVPSAGVG